MTFRSISDAIIVMLSVVYRRDDHVHDSCLSPHTEVSFAAGKICSTAALPTMDAFGWLSQGSPLNPATFLRCACGPKLALS
jgi:hypothetical protein